MTHETSGKRWIVILILHTILDDEIQNNGKDLDFPRDCVMVKTMKTLDTNINEIVRRVVAAVQPEKIILFGSSARGDTNSASDFDLLVVKPCLSRRQIAGKIYRALIGFGHAVDVVVVTPEDITRYGANPALILEPALREGIVLYAA
ncbi:MAG: nucleotidyltransferase domain-containing protein [Kiritimatiellia bacterium]|nr:nucleotidyltransferase domain-containing protein [Kiritimatiellia bacterium]